MKSPICVKCRLVMTIKKTGVDVEHMADAERPYQIWMGDIYSCRSCGTEIVCGFGHTPVAEHFQTERYAKFLPGVLLRFWDKIADLPVRSA